MTSGGNILMIFPRTNLLNFVLNVTNITKVLEIAKH